MQSALQVKEIPLLLATQATSATTSHRIDTLGYRYASLETWLPKATATNSSAKWGVLKVTEGDLTSLTSASAIVKLTGTTNTVTDATNGYVIAAHNNTSIPQVTKLQLDLRGRKRYLFLTVQAPDSHSTVLIKAQLTRGDQTPDTDALRGVGVSSQA